MTVPPDNLQTHATAVVNVQGLSKVFRDFWQRPQVRAVDGIDFSIAPGRVFGLLGPNGSGKSTTIKMLLGLLRPSAGSIQILGAEPTATAAKERLGYLPEETGLHRFLTPRETFDFYGRLFRMSGRERRSRTEQLLAMLGLDSAADRPIGECSKGMARRAGLGQALINDPDLLILDEPTAGLDPIGCRQIKDLILILASRGKTILLTSHLLADVEDVCDHIAILYQGRIRAQGTVHDLLSNRDAWHLTVPALAAEPMRALLASLRHHLGSEPELRHPTLDLEQFFLRIIAEAEAGAGGRPATAEFLTRGAVLVPHERN